ncbi:MULTISPECIES: hypothetical protein [unclassified Agrococcus]|uniref:hypothetical protein n=1 Tax=unclassified Agrococcus TaxID=2615065 RepID=UPI003607A54F
MASGDHRTGSDSRCCSPREFPLTWIDHQDHEHEDIAAVQAWLATLRDFARDHEIGEIRELLDAAAHGMLEDTGDEKTPIKPVRREPEIYELRHQALSKAMRFYHGEPAHRIDLLVGLHHHIKVSKAHQRAAIAHAAERYYR